MIKVTWPNRWAYLRFFLIGCCAIPSAFSAAGQYSESAKVEGGVLVSYAESAPNGFYFSQKVARQLETMGWVVDVLSLNRLSDEEWQSHLAEKMAVMRQKVGTKLAVIMYGEECDRLLEYFTQPQAKQVGGLVFISAVNGERFFSNSTTDIRLRFPLLDIVAQFDYKQVLSDQKKRQKLVRSAYQSYTVSGADHYYQYQLPVLVNVVHLWLEDLPSTKIHRAPVNPDV
ncbi:MAG: hypothetical protein JJT82_03045 [Legionellaceae bacterium]|nr:hypothetical protein [Legionellaceae bacterium]